MLFKQAQHLKVLQMRSDMNKLTEKSNTYLEDIQNHKTFIETNARPTIEISSEVDKFRCFLQDVVSYEPDYILKSEKPRLHFYQEEYK